MLHSHSCPTLIFKLLIPPSAHSVSSPSLPSLAPGYLSSPPASSPLTLLGFSNGMLKVFEPGVLNYFTFSSPILLTFSVNRNIILTHLPLSGFLNSLLCILIAPTPDLAFSLLMPRALAGGVVIFVRQGLSFSELSTSSLSSLDPYSDYVRINISLNNCSSLSLPNVYAPPPPIPFLPPFFPPPEISSFWGTSIAITASVVQEVLPTPAKRKYSTGSSLLTSSPLNDPDTPTLLHRASPDICFAPSFLAPGKCCRTWVLTTYQFFFLSLSLRSFAPTSVLHPSTFRKLAGMILSPTCTSTVLLQRNTHHRFPLLLLFLSLWH